MLAVTSPKLTGLVFLFVPLVVAPIVVFGRIVRRLSRAAQDQIADVSAYAGETLDAARTVQAFTHEPVDIARFRDQVERAFDMAMRRVRARAMLPAPVILLVFGAEIGRASCRESVFTYVMISVVAGSFKKKK